MNNWTEVYIESFSEQFLSEIAKIFLFEFWRKICHSIFFIDTTLNLMKFDSLWVMTSSQRPLKRRNFKVYFLYEN